MKHTVDIDWLRERLEYVPIESGSSLVWKVANGSAVHAGDRAGTYRKTNGRWEICLFGKLMQSHRVVWALCHGYFPDCQIDHIDRNPSNNRIENLRLAKRNELDNGQNRKLNSNNTSGHVGVSYHSASEKWYAQIQANKKHKFLGFFMTKEEAIAARKEAERHLFTFAGETK